MRYFFSICLAIGMSSLIAQSESAMDKMAKSTELAIPASPAFNMLNENVPSRIQRYASLHDFKVDWSMTNGQQGYTLSPGIALEAPPVWLLMFDRAGASKYREASRLTRMLSTLSLSIGTNASNNKNWLAWGAKLNLYRQSDPLNDPVFLNALESATQGAKDSILLQIKDFEKAQIMLDRRKPDYDKSYNAIEDSILSVQYIIEDIERQQSQRLVEARESYIQENWNASYVDLAFGRLLTYAQLAKQISNTVTDPLSGSDSIITIDQNTLELSAQGYGVWLSGGVGVGRNILLSGMARYGKRPSLVDENVSETLSGGFNLRYGTRRYNFFIEGFLDKTKDQFKTLGGATIERTTYMMTFGGDWRISKNVLLSFGIRQTRDFLNETYLLQPLINVNCLMR